MTEFNIFVSEENEFAKEAGIATYYYRLSNPEVMKIAKMMASEQTTGTWIKVPGESKELLLTHHGRILNVWEIPDYENSSDVPVNEERDFIIQIGYPTINIGFQISQESMEMSLFSKVVK